MRPLVDQRPHDKQAENRRPLSQFLQEAAAHIANDIDTFTVAISHAVVAHQQAHQVKQDKEQQGAHQAAAHRDTCAQGRKYRAHGTPEDRVTHAGQRPHQTDFNAVYRSIVDRRSVGALFFHGHGHAEYRSSHIRMGVKELKVTFDRLFAVVVIFRVQTADYRYHRITKTQRLHTFEVPRTLEQV
ncbi:Uncharacterised protein [Klebsiella pneumoniae]|nr:Uncharacterised protein [Klebsiella pneumoniae]